MPLTGPEVLDAEFDVCVIGAGPGGLACALRAHDRGLRVLVLEAGGEQPIPGQPDILAADIVDGKWHDPVDIVSAAALGGSSHWWGGRSVPFDPVDFRFWPLTYEEMLPWWDEGAAFLGSKSVYETPAPGAFANLSAFDAVRSECWGPQLNMAKRWKARLKGANSPAIVLNTRATGLSYADGRVTGVQVRIGDQQKTVRARHVVVACGGLGGMRLLLLAQRETPSLFGGPDGMLGKGYMGHLTGSVAELVPAHLEDVKGFAGSPLGGGSFARRRMRPSPETVIENDLCNIAFWLENAAIDDPGQGSAVGSARYVAARMVRLLKSRGRGGGPGQPLGPHLAAIAKSPVSAATGLGQAAYLLLSAKLTGRHPHSTILLPNSRGALPMYYHAEHLPDPTNRVSLSTNTDSLGLPRLHIDFRMSDKDIDSVVRAHALLDKDLQAAGAGRVVMKGDAELSHELVRQSTRDGYHQLGGAVMSTDPAKGVVDTECRAHGVENLWVASSNVFPSGSQANPTLTIAALACRIADRIAGVR